MVLAFLLQAANPAPTSALDLITQATRVSQVILVFLAILSLLSWVVMFAAWRDIGRVQRAGRAFLRQFEQAPRIEAAAALVRQSSQSSFTRLFTMAMRFVSETRARNRGTDADAIPTAQVAVAQLDTEPLTASQVETLHLILETEAAGERDRLGRHLPWLATIGSVSPLIGLFGTVLGVIDAFVGIATQGSGNLAAVAPGVAEALIATAAALAVAIPATFAYNILANKLNRVDAVFETFSTALIAMLAREGHV
ncbi:MAG: MotA/TolQ/ExbB proton channel family protein [Gemmatimonadaceae bacterium]|nr:MotA/TolQ/ExbB proton channel family protein [Gemmatimonadaceae bacterium]